MPKSVTNFIESMSAITYPASVLLQNPKKGVMTGGKVVTASRDLGSASSQGSSKAVQHTLPSTSPRSTTQHPPSIGKMRTFTLLSSLAAAVTAVLADCSSLGSGASNAVSGTFNLAAFNPATNVTSPLHVLNAVTIPLTTYHVTASSPTFGWLGLTMSGGVITTITPRPTTSPAYTVGNLSPNSGFPPNPPGPFVTFANTGTPSSAFCVVPENISGANQLVVALNGFTNLFSICESFVSQTLTDTPVLLFNASRSAFGDGNDTYDGSSCVSVTLLAVPA
ncbi:hypothetical protein BC629DRAFT_1588485 [Irpex lacteus]|nr:hypothetical protein BC629DRAFT_1588485 [Irpex lacteus]